MVINTATTNIESNMVTPRHLGRTLNHTGSDRWLTDSFIESDTPVAVWLLQLNAVRGV